jgi:hypothetical protein
MVNEKLRKNHWLFISSISTLLLMVDSGISGVS